MSFSDAISNALADTGGAAGVEFALMAPAMILFAIGTVDVGAMAYEKAEVAAAAHAAAYYAMVNGGVTGSIQTAAQNATPLGIGVTATASQGYACSNLSSITLSATAPTNCSPATVATYIQVNTSASYTPVISWGALGISTTTLYGSAMVRIG
jgi:Flp pilus assembly protein TadG